MAACVECLTEPTKAFMHFLLTNDDGIHAPGLAAMMEAVNGIPGATWTAVAPHVEMSSCGHRVTTETSLKVDRLDHQRYSVTGTPADCVRIGLFALGIRPDFVLSGVNPGGNMGHDVHISGTAAGAREAAYHGLRSAAISHYIRRGLKLNWSIIAPWTTQMIQELTGRDLGDGEFWNVNYPHLESPSPDLPDRVATEKCRSPMLVSYESPEPDVYKYNAAYGDRPRDPGSDVAVCFGGSVSVSKLRV